MEFFDSIDEEISDERISDEEISGMAHDNNEMVWYYSKYSNGEW